MAESTHHPDASWLFVELGGTSSQTSRRDRDGRFWFTPGVAAAHGRPVALACPGVIQGDRVLYATSLGWPADADPRRELGIPTIALVENDAVAAGLGEAVLRAGGGAPGDLIYLSLGTGVGSAAVRAGRAYDLDVGHLAMGGASFCEGCRSYGCLNSLLEARRLPQALTPETYAFIAEQLAGALGRKGADAHIPIVLGGGIVRRHPAIADHLAARVPNPVGRTLAPPEAKSAAAMGLAYLVRRAGAGG